MSVIDLKECRSTEDDYIIDVIHPSGKTIQVMVPIDGDDIYEGQSYGLNMVFDGHYT